MATSKSRSNKRSSSGTCYSSTTTTIIFITLSGLFLWLLSSNSFSPPQQSAATTTTKTSTTKISSISHSDHHHHQSDDEPASISEHLHLEPEQLPTDDHTRHADDDPIKSNENQDEEVNDAASSDDHPHHSDHATTTSDNDSDNNKDNDDVTDSKTETELPKIVGSSNDHHLQGKESVDEEEKQAALETQTSEESTVTQQQHIQQTKQQQSDDHDHDQKHGTNSETISQSHDEVTDGDGQQMKKENHDHDRDDDHKQGTNSETISQNHDEITDEDGQKRIEEHQKQEDEQFQINEQKWQSSNDPHGATSHDQIQHDEQDPTAVHDQDHQHETNDNDEHVMNHEILKHDSSNKKNGAKASSLPSKEPKKTWSTQADQSVSEKERRNAGSNNEDGGSIYGYEWQLCNTSAGADYIPCLDNEKVIAHLHSRKHHEHRERHCPEEPPTCLVPIPHGYKRRIDWPQSRDKIWYHNVPHTLLAEVKGHQNWVKVVGEFLTFPGGGTQFIHGALHYIDFIQEAVPDIAWGKHSRVVLDVGCGVASFGGFLFEREVLTMSFAPKDEHEAQVQFALERGIPAISAVMGSQRLPFPSRVFDVVHCARCRVPWHADGGALLLELNRVLRPGGYFVWSATPVYQKLEEDVQIWREMSNLTVAMCWELITIKKDKLNSIGAAIYRKPETNDCYEQRKRNQPPMCKNDDDSNAAWYVPLQSCMHKAPVGENERGSQWPEEWPERLQTPPYWLNKSEMGIFGKPSPVDFASDHQHWKKVVGKSYLNGLGISWSNVRNVMDMRAVYGGFAAALKEMKVWVMNVVNTDSPDTLPIIYERGLFGIYHDWCESFSTYPRTYDLLHADHLFSGLKKRCKLVTVVAEVDRIVRPGGKLIVMDDSKTIGQIENMLKSLHWKVFLNLSENEQHVILSAQKSETWRPDSYEPAS